MALRTKIKLNFDTPQINEVVFGVGLNPKKFNPTFFGRFYDRIKNEFPKISKQTPIVPFGMNNISYEAYHPRIWFETSDKIKLIQMQPDRFHYNWRKQEQEEHQYPGFENIYEQFKAVWVRYNSWLKEENMFDNSMVNRLELTYIDHINKGILWKDFNEIDKVVNFFKSPNIEENSFMDGLNVAFSFSLGTDGNLVYIIRNGIKKSTQESVLVLELTMRKECDTNENFDSWFIKAHDHIAKVFIGSLSNEALKEWGYKRK